MYARNVRRCLVGMSPVYGNQSLRFYKSIHILNYSKLVIDIQTLILLTILLFIDHTLWRKLEVYINTHVTHITKKPSTIK